MVVVLVFAVTLLAAVLTSALAERTVYSAAVLFLVAGFVFGHGVFGVISYRPDDAIVASLAELALFTVLFTDGMAAGWGDIKSCWRLPGRALLFGLPLTMVLTGILARYIVGLPWVQSLLLGAVLSPTDPVFIAAIVGREDVPKRLRDLLNLESGLNDGLALPVVLYLLARAGSRSLEIGQPLGEAAAGIGVGVIVPWVAIRAERSRFFDAAEHYMPLLGVAVGLTVLSVTFLLNINSFLAAFAAGVTVATVSPAVRDAFNRFGEILTELLKLAALLIFASLLSMRFFTGNTVRGIVFALLALVAVRPVALAFALFGARLSWREWIAAAWFGPKGFSSVTYGLFVLTSGIPRGMEVAHLAALVILGSMIAHSSTDVVVARWFRKSPDAAAA